MNQMSLVLVSYDEVLIIITVSPTVYLQVMKSENVKKMSVDF